MLKRESEQLVEPLLGFIFSSPPANSTCIVVVLFIVWKFLWFFFKCAVHISLTELIKGNECFKFTSAFLIYWNHICGMFLIWGHSAPSLLFSFPSASPSFLPAFPYSWMDFPSKVTGTFCILPCLLVNGKGRNSDSLNEKWCGTWFHGRDLFFYLPPESVYF